MRARRLSSSISFSFLLSSQLLFFSPVTISLFSVVLVHHPSPLFRLSSLSFSFSICLCIVIYVHACMHVYRCLCVSACRRRRVLLFVDLAGLSVRLLSLYLGNLVHVDDG